MNLSLVSYKREPEAPTIMYELLLEREPYMNISHQEMPTWEQHLVFMSRPGYRAWYLIKVGPDYVGSIYLTMRNEVGIFVFQKHRGHGYGSRAFALLKVRWSRMINGRISLKRKAFIANIAPTNAESMLFFKKLGFTHVSNCYALDVD